MFYVYHILNLINGKMYIGQTKDPIRRWHKHIATACNSNKSKSHRLIHKVIKKYGPDNFEFTVFQELKTFQEALLAEVYWINFYQTNVIRYGDQFGYNLSDGGDGCGSGPKSETHKNNISKSLLGKEKSKEHCNHLMISNQKFSYDEVKTITNLLLQDISQYEIAKLYNVSQTIISDIKIGKSYSNISSPQEIEMLRQLTTSHAGEKNGSAKLKTFQVKEIKRLILEGNLTTKQISVMYHVDYKLIFRIKNGETWKHIK